MSVDVETAFPETPDPRFRRWVAVLVGLAAVSATLLAFLESNSGRQEEKAFVDASRSALAVFVDLGASGPRFQFEVGAARESTLLDTRATARAAASSFELLPLQVALAVSGAENEASRRLLEVSQALRRVPPSAEGLDERASKAIRVREQADIEPLVAAQNDALERADRYGTRQERAMFGLGLIAIAASLLGLAGLMGAGRAGRMVLLTSALTLVLALGWGTSGLLV